MADNACEVYIDALNNFNAVGEPPPSGNPYQLAAWAFNNAWHVAGQKSAQSMGLFQQAQDAASAPTATPAVFSFTPNVVEPIVNIPQQAEGASIARFYEMSAAIIAQLSGLYADWLTAYAPDDTQWLLQTQEWITKALTTGGTGMNPSVEAQIWARDRSRILKETERAEEEVLTTWAARRYPLPPGAAAWQMQQVRKDAADKIAAASRDVAIKQAEIEIANVRLAVGEAIKLYGAYSGAAGDYLKALAVGPTSAMQVVPSITDSQSRLIAAANEYYGSRIRVEEMRMKASMPTVEWDQQTRIRNAEFVVEEIKQRTAAAVAAAQSLGTQAASALNSLHVAAGVNAGTTNGVSYHYSNDTVSAAPTLVTVGG